MKLAVSNLLELPRGGLPSHPARGSRARRDASLRRDRVLYTSTENRRRLTHPLN